MTTRRPRGAAAEVGTRWPDADEILSRMLHTVELCERDGVTAGVYVYADDVRTLVAAFRPVEPHDGE